MKVCIATSVSKEKTFLLVLKTIPKILYSKRWNDRFPDTIFWDLVIDDSEGYCLFDLGWYFYKLSNLNES